MGEDGRASHWLLVFQHELVGGHLRTEHGGLPRVLGMAQEVAFLDELETGGVDFLPYYAFLDPVQRLGNVDAVAGLGGMIGDNKEAAGFQRRQHLLVHDRAIDLHIADVVIGEEGNHIEAGNVGRDRIVEIPDDMHDVFHDRLLGADVELVLDEALDHGGRILRVDSPRGSDGARQQFGAVAGAGFHIEYLHAGLDAGEGQHFGGLAARVGLTVAIGPVLRGDDRLIVRRLLRPRARNGEHCNDSYRTDSRYTPRYRSDHESFPLFPATYQGHGIRSRSQIQQRRDRDPLWWLHGAHPGHIAACGQVQCTHTRKNALLPCRGSRG